MPLQVIKSLKNKTSQMAYNSVLYNWSLSGEVPDRFVVRPVDPWPGRADRGRSVCGDACALEGDQLDIEEQVNQVDGLTDLVSHDVHDFTWLRDLRALGGDAARRQARAMITQWAHHHHKWDAQTWHPGVMGERLAMWVSLYDFYGGTLDNEFQDVLFESAIRQARHLSRVLPGDVYGIDLLKGLKGLLYCGLAFEGYEYWVDQALSIAEVEIEKQILGDGAHISRSPAQLLNALQIMLDIRTALASGGYPLPEKIQHAVDRMGPALRFFRYSDKHFALFNGTQEAPVSGGQDFVDCVLGQANVRGKGLQSLLCAGYERLSQGRTTVMFDCGHAPAYPYDAFAHAAPLAFEMSYGKDRLFVSCGTHPGHEGWRDALRATAAHNTAVIDNRNAYEIRENGHFSRKSENFVPLRDNAKEAMSIECGHNGYLALNGITHTRRLRLSDKGHDLRGEDMFTTDIRPGAPKEVVIRFHIHPRVNVSLVQSGQSALLRLPGGIGWRFEQSGGVLAMEESIYLGQGGEPRKTRQLVIYGQIHDFKSVFKWSACREG